MKSHATSSEFTSSVRIIQTLSQKISPRKFSTLKAKHSLRAQKILPQQNVKWFLVIFWILVGWWCSLRRIIPPCSEWMNLKNHNLQNGMLWALHFDTHRRSGFINSTQSIGFKINTSNHYDCQTVFKFIKSQD